MTKTSKIDLLLKSSVAPAVLGMAMIASPAYAQDEDNDEMASAANVAQPAIVVTGSRITNPNLEQASPVQVVGEEEINLRQATNANELLGNLPGIVPGISNNVNNGGAGFSTLNLRNLGSNRNLVLLDGSRLVPSTTTSVVDLNIIPVALIERVEVVTGGASSVYGADAIAGVANFVLRRDFAGAELATTFGITQEGDAPRFRADLTLGANFDDGRGNAVLSIGYQDVDPLLQSQRAISREGLFINGAVVGSGTTLPTKVTSDLDLMNPNWNAPDPDDRTNSDLGANQLDPATGQFVPAFNTFNFAPFNYFQTPLERWNIYGQANYEITPGIEVYARGMYTKSTVQLRLAPSGLFGDTWQLPLNNPFLTDTMRQQICAGQGFQQVPNPFFVDMETTPDEPMTIAGPNRNISAAECSAAGAATGPGDPNYREVAVTINRRLVEQGARLRDAITNQFQVWAGLRGGITDLIDYDVFATFGESERTQTSRNWGLQSRVQQALRAVDPTTCQDPSNGCFPINLFGGGTGQNIDQRSVDFFNQPAIEAVRTNLTQVVGSIFGDLSDTGWLWADTPIGFALGAEYRRYLAEQVADVAASTQDEVLGTGAPSPNFRGEYDVAEVFAELIVPIVEDVPGFYSLTAEGGVRISDYSNTGTSVTWKAGGSWEPLLGFKFRGVYQRSVRSPNVSELFQPNVTGLTGLVTDPCAGSNPLGNAALTNICIAQGAPPTTIGLIPPPSASQANATFGGNPDLDVEKARSWTIGAVITPPSVPGLAVTADYYDIKVTDAITTPTSGDIVGPCFNGTDPAVCSQIGRNPLNGSLNGGGDTLGVILPLTNQGVIETRGIDLRINYNMPTGFGSLNFDFNGNWTDTFLFQATPTAVNRECVGFYSENCEPLLPEWSFNFRTTASFDDLFDVSLLWQWIDSMELEPISSAATSTNPPTSDEFRSIGDYSYFDLTVRTNMWENFELVATIENLLDKDPPNVSSFVGSSAFNSGNTYPTTYDVLGRRFVMTGRLRF